MKKILLFLLISLFGAALVSSGEAWARKEVGGEKSARVTAKKAVSQKSATGKGAEGKAKVKTVVKASGKSSKKTATSKTVASKTAHATKGNGASPLKNAGTGVVKAGVAAVAVRHVAAVDDYESAFAAIDAGRVEAGAAFATQGHDPVLNMVLRGYAMAQPGNSYSFDALADFITSHPDWPNLKAILMIAEQKIPSDADPAQIVNWFYAHEPLTLGGFYRFIESLYAVNQTQHIPDFVRARWIEKDFTAETLSTFYDRFGSYLRPQDHRARLDRLLWANDVSDVKAMYAYVGAAQKSLAEARLALNSGAKNAWSYVARVPASEQDDAGLLYERLRLLRKEERNNEAVQILLRAPADLGHAGKWWDERNIILRRAIEGQDYELAYRLASHHGLKNDAEKNGADLVEAEFVSGWLALRFLNKPDLAQKHFAVILQYATTPVSRARGHYWMGRVYEALGQKKYAEESYEEAAALNTTFYGQLAITRLYANPVIRANPEPSIPAEVRARFFSRDTARAIEKLYDIGEKERARVFFKGITEAATQRYEFALLMELAYQLQRPDWAIRAAKAANQKNMLVAAGAFPVLSINIPSPPDPAFTHAVIRQESLFNTDAGSPVGARGLMQLMPATAQEMARKLDMSYAPSKLTDPDYNLRLGTAFMQRQIENFDGSLILSLAGYNAGPRRAREWMQKFGDPRTNQVDPVDWIEMIPISETRNYVQRIIENYQFYRARLNGGQAPLQIEQDLRR